MGVSVWAKSKIKGDCEGGDEGTHHCASLVAVVDRVEDELEGVADLPRGRMVS